MMSVSVVIATFGGIEWRDLAIERALPSIEAQSQDVTEVRLVHGRSLNDARNAGALAASGDWLCFVDADDELEAGYMQAMAGVLTDERHWSGQLTPPRLLVPAVRYLDVRGRPLGEPSIPNADPVRSLVEVNRAVIGTLIPRELFIDLGGFGTEPIYEDWSLWLRAVRAGATVVHAPSAVYRAWRRRGSRNTFTGDSAEWYWRIRDQHEGSCPELTP